VIQTHGVHIFSVYASLNDVLMKVYSSCHTFALYVVYMISCFEFEV
jgi:hypothetical protein